MPNRSPPNDTAQFIAAMAADLSAMARQSGYPTLAYLLDMVKLEADNAVAQAPRPDPH
jgi:hypothetical protein